MAERVNIDLVTQVGVETTPGTPVAATKQLQTMQIIPSIKVSTSPFTPSGYKYPSVVVYNKEWTEAKMNGEPSYGELVYFLSSVLCQALITTPLTSPVARTWTFNPSSNAADVVKTFTVEHGDAVRGEQFAFGIAKSFDLKISRDKIEISGDMLGQRTVDGFTMTALTPVSDVQTITITGSPAGGTFTLGFNGATTGPIAYNATASAVQTALQALSTIGTGNVTCTGGPLPGTGVVCTFAGTLANQAQNLLTHTDSLTGGTTPAVAIAHTTPGNSITPEPAAQVLQPNQIDCFFDTSSGALGSTKFLRDFDFDWSVSDRFQDVWPLNSANTSFAAAVEKMPKAEIKATLASDAQGMALLTALRASQTYYVRLQASGPVADAVNAVNFGATFDSAVKISAIGDPKEFEGIYVREFTGQIVHDPTWGTGKAMSVSVTNKQLAL